MVNRAAKHAASRLFQLADPAAESRGYLPNA
jgi:hypothetical protein